MSDYFKLDFKVKPYNIDAADLLAAFLADAGFESFEETPEGMAAYVQKDIFNPEALTGIVDGFPMEVDLSWELSFIEHQDWNEEWEKKYFQPLVLAGGRCVIHSSFHKDYPEAEVDITVDPKMAFGTGHHATTSMMVNFLFGIDIKGKKVIDMGTGTGILAIVAKKLGSGETVGIEIDPAAYENALENIALNQVAPLILQGDARELDAFRDIDIFLANINRNIILQDLKAYVATLSPSGIILLSGFYLADVAILEKALEEFGFRISEVSSQGDWAAVKATKDK